MCAETTHLRKLVARVKQGDPAAPQALYQELEPQLVHRVRRVVRLGVGESPVDQWILKEAERFARQGRSPPYEDREWLIEPVAQRLCTIMIEQLQPASLKETKVEDATLRRSFRSPLWSTQLN